MLIGLAGYARSGKDSCGLHLSAAGFRRVAFADKVRELAEKLYPGILERHGNWDAAKFDPEVRARLQLVGEEGRRVLGEDVWLNATLPRPPDGDLVITDVRHPNEARRIKELGGFVLRVERPGVGPVNGHISEVALDDWPFDGVVANDGSTLDLGLVLWSAIRQAQQADATHA